MSKQWNSCSAGMCSPSPGRRKKACVRACVCLALRGRTWWPYGPSGHCNKFIERGELLTLVKPGRSRQENYGVSQEFSSLPGEVTRMTDGSPATRLAKVTVAFWEILHELPNGWRWNRHFSRPARLYCKLTLRSSVIVSHSVELIAVCDPRAGVPLMAHPKALGSWR